MIRSARTIAIALILVSACATPIPPSGGPPDETPPALSEAVPTEGAVDVDTDYVRLTFSEYVDASSFAQAFSISPSFTQPVDFSWSGRSVVIRFPEPLRENTTYVLTIDTNLRDANRVALSSPIVYAFSTGPTISAGVLSGQVISARAGAPSAGIDVLAYPLPDSTAPDSLPDLPAYRTQTGSDGAFRFEYLTEQFYYVAALRDGNRNLQPDAQEPFAAPPVPALFADSTRPDLARPWVVARVDTVSPTALRVQPVSVSRHVMRFSEPVRFLVRDPDSWTLADSATGTAAVIRELFIRTAEPREVHVLTENLMNRRYRLSPGGLVDTSGNPVLPTPQYFSPAASDDTLTTRFEGFLPEASAAADPTILPRTVEAGIRFNQPLTESDLANAVAVTDTLETSLGFAAVTRNGTDYEILPDPTLAPGQQIIVSVDAQALSGPDTTYTRSYRRISSDETGEVTGVVQLSRARTPIPAGTDRDALLDTAQTTGPDTTAVDQTIVPDTTVAEESDVPDATPNEPLPTAPIVVELRASEVALPVPNYTTVADASGRFAFNALPAGTYHLRAFADADSSGSWDPGLLEPYRPPESITWRAEPVRVRSRWETALPDTVRIPIGIELSDTP